jgi:hypothetical protein
MPDAPDRRLSFRYFQPGPGHNVVVIQTIGRFEGFDRCAVGPGNAGQRIAGFDHVKSPGMTAGRCILII